MLNHIHEIRILEIKCDVINTHKIEGLSFKKKRRIRKITRLKQYLEKALILKKSKYIISLADDALSGPTQETRAKLTPDPLIRFSRDNILNNQQIWIFKQIRRAITIITYGTQARTSRFDDVRVQTSRFGQQPEGDFEIKIKENYSNWVDRMTAAKRPVGPVLDVIIDELSLSAIDRKWGKRKGWAKGYLQDSLDLFGHFR